MNTQSVRYFIFLLALIAAVVTVYLISQRTDMPATTAPTTAEPKLSEYTKVEQTTLELETALQTATDTAHSADSSLPATNITPSTKSTTAKSDTPPTSVDVPKPSAPKKSATKVQQRPVKKRVRKYASMTFDHMHYDFGDITEGDIVNHVFTFTNTSDTPLEIKSAKASCGCTKPTYPFINIGPGESNVIRIDYHSVSKSGPQAPEIVIEANVADSPIILTMGGNVLAKEKQKDSTKVATKPSTSEDKEIPKNKVSKIKKDSLSKIAMSKDSLR